MTPLLRAELRIGSAAPARGGCIHRCHVVTVEGARRFLKVNHASFEDAFAAEADGLAALREAGLRAPEPLAHGVAGGEAYLMLEYLELQGRGDFAALGTMLAAAHRRTAERFGWRRDNSIGATPQANAWHDDWSAFWLERRLRPQLELARSRGFAMEEVPVERLLQGHRPQASLLHGDLWSGNAGFLAGGAPVLFDPAVYHGDREADLAMTELFGGFPTEFYAAYGEAYPLPPGYETRKHLYNLYHLLNHLNLFGEGYLAQVVRTLGLLRRAL